MSSSYRDFVNSLPVANVRQPQFEKEVAPVVAAASKPAPSVPSVPSVSSSASAASHSSAFLAASLGRILRPQAAYRWLMPQLASITPQYIEMVLRGALAGNHVQQWELFDLMLDTWPELAACAAELTEGVLEKDAIFEAYTEEGMDPTDSANEKCKLVSAALRGMMPNAAADENDLDDTIRDIVDGWFRGVTVLETDWQMLSTQTLGNIVAPRATYWVHPVCFAWGMDGKLGLRVDRDGKLANSISSSTIYQPNPGSLAEFPEHKFLIGIHKAKSGTALGGGLLRPLAWWWCAANFASDWVLNLAQVFGLPFRWANYDPNAPEATISAICNMLQNMGSAGWAAFPSGTTLDLKDAGKGSDHSPQGELLDRADRYARLLILGQTLSGGQSSSKGGGKAFGEVEAEVKIKRIEAAAKYVAKVFNKQLIPSIVALNYGAATELPTMRLLKESEGSVQEAQRDQILANAGLEIGEDFLRQKYNIPAPKKGEKTIGGKSKSISSIKSILSTKDPEDEAASDLADTEQDEQEALESRALHAALSRISTIEDDRIFARALQACARATNKKQ